MLKQQLPTTTGDGGDEHTFSEPTEVHHMAGSGQLQAGDSNPFKVDLGQLADSFDRNKDTIRDETISHERALALEAFRDGIYRLPTRAERQQYFDQWYNRAIFAQHRNWYGHGQTNAQKQMQIILQDAQDALESQPTPKCVDYSSTAV